MLKEFREFIAKGNVLDLAVGIIIGAAFTAIVQSLVKDIINPVIGMFGKASFDNMFLVLKAPPSGITAYFTPEDAEKAGAVVLKYGSFLTNVINFLIVAVVVFLIVRAANKVREAARKKEETAKVVEAAKISEEVVLLREIRDLLRASRTSSEI
jgi:large conductance mechanosensitive channel